MLPTLSSLSVSKSPASRLRHWCSSEYLRISPLHSEFRLPLLHSRTTVSMAVYGLSPYISPLTCSPACAPFTPSKSGQRSPPTYYRGCWHVVSRGLFVYYRHYPPLFTAGTFVINKRALRSENLHHSRGIAPSGFRPLRKIPHCCLP